jgi:hypothetical protein
LKIFLKKPACTAAKTPAPLGSEIDSGFFLSPVLEVNLALVPKRFIRLLNSETRDHSKQIHRLDALFNSSFTRAKTAAFHLLKRIPMTGSREKPGETQTYKGTPVMNKIMNTAFFATTALLSLSSAFADDIRLGIPGTGGTGCPAGTVSATLSPDQKTLSLIFDQYVVQAGGYTGQRIGRKNCQIALPIHVPQGYSFSIIQMDYRGFNALPAGASSQFNVEYFLAFPGAPVSGPRYSQRFYGPLNSDYLIPNQIGVSAAVWSPCGADLNLRTNTSMMVMSNSSNEEAMSTVDSIDAKGSILYQLQWRRCGGGGMNPSRPSNSVELGQIETDI